MKVKIGDNIIFTAHRIFNGNPVEGKLVSEDGEWIGVELSHSIEGMNAVWDKGETKRFRKSLISNPKKS